MAHEDRIRQLTDIFIEDLRQPVEASLRQLLAQMMGIAVREQSSVVEATRQQADERHERELEEALLAKDQERERMLDALREELAGYHQQALDGLYADLERRSEDRSAALVAQAVNDAEIRLEALREELTRRHEEALERLVGQAVADGEARLDALREELTRERDQAVERLVGQAVDDGEARLEALREELTRDHEGALMNLVGQALNDGEGRLQALREELAREHEASLAAMREQLTGEHEPGLAALATVERERDAARAMIAGLTDELAEARARHEQLTQLAHAESEAADQLLAGRSEAYVEERQADLACSERLVSAIRALDASGTLSEVLAVLSGYVSTEHLRAAVLVVQGARVRGWRFSAMGEANATDVDVPLEKAGAIGRAVLTGSPASTTAADADAEQHALPAFLLAPPGRVGLALPILVGGRTVAVLYADDGMREERVVPSNWPEVAEVVTRHAGRCLEALTLARANGFAHRPPPASATNGSQSAALLGTLPAPPPDSDETREEESARRYARLLISEIKLYNESLVEQGRREGTLLPLLGAEIERARRLYEEKIPAAVRERVNCFDEEIVRTLAGGDRMLLGQVT